MRIINVKDYEEMSRKAADLIAAQIILNPKSVLGLATGSSPIGTYERLVELNRNGVIDFSHVTTINLDEYYGLDPTHDQSYRYFMNKHLFSRVNINMANTHLPDGKAKDIDAECRRYDDLIESVGGIDLQLLGIGHNGHIGFNEPSDEFIPGTHCVSLSESTINANSRFFKSRDEVPRKAITMGIKAIMQARKVLLIASGEDKKEILKKALFGPITPQVPASILQLHKDLTVITPLDI
ncbi:glucosamine-6-phosphate deaminase NagB [Thermoclostridium stercorarium subsp. stercorarium DSM 8532]|jgi:glucosamine-6-phosphate deaminase|uniref:Glucosamine-6-phosphate deaminase n=2 Tax=Thermoclostridium stercorarium TaxID=1510 RepID=L7VTQ8_THES1|nr:glucosamine-6-phosphate deaminase [Thermoclostridium stercorarium]AGC68963.1 glucosamine-6-phosphate deaminase NagB [Thermoclostridium stercorarium subsp. stercorarium DSM 8532]AGI39944.1 glucosamine-6-phosphate isomerase [Thermoclostridium stercorarium subsp. stercorarium DSM 8532]ANW99265.1 glucosamine-6-phosphate deaminase [Thermoclostridium stercorarium subsp. thermolacticum DSM 2910]UZQ84938.1 glucosamine-6-phosphate deaminase [Thermoclostridium stercorarium]